MYLHFESIRIKRFRSFQDEALLYFDEAGVGLYFIKGKNKAQPHLGPNGVGKSSIVDALLWCLYGKTVQGLKNPDIIPWSGKGKTEVEVIVLVDKTVHAIKRTANPNKLTIDGEEAGQDYVSKLIAIPFEILPYTVILGQRMPLFFDLGSTAALKLFSEVLNLDRWEARSAHAAERVKNLDTEISSSQYALEALQKAQSQALADFNNLKQQSATWETERASKLSNAEDEQKRLHKQIASVANERDTADLTLDRALTELKAISPALDKLRVDERKSSTALHEATNWYQSLHLQIERLKKDKEQVDSGKCPACGKPLEDKKAKQKATKVELAKLEVDFKTAVEDYKKIEDAHTKIEVAIDAQLAAKQQFETDAENARDILDRLLPKIANWEAEIKALERELQRNENDGNPYTEQLQTLRRRRDLNKNAIEQAEKSIKEKTEYLERVKFWVKGFKQIKLLTIEEILQELEIASNCYCADFGLVDWEIKYDIERETKSGTIARGLNITVFSPDNKKPVRWECWSGGEGQRLRIIGTLALSSVLLNHLGISTNLSVFDEPTQSLSKEGIQDLVEILAQYAKESKKNVWVIDHNTIESRKFVSVVTVLKDKKGSWIDSQILD